MSDTDTPAPEPKRNEVRIRVKDLDSIEVRNSESAKGVLASMQAAFDSPSMRAMAEQASKALADMSAAYGPTLEKFRETIPQISPSLQSAIDVNTKVSPGLLASRFVNYEPSYDFVSCLHWRSREEQSIDALRQEVREIRAEVSELRRPIGQTDLRTERMAKHFDPDPN